MMRDSATSLVLAAWASLLGGWSGAQAPAPDPELMQVYLGRDTLLPSVVGRVLPEYPASALRNPFTGSIDVETVVSTTGVVIQTRAVGVGQPAFEAAAADAARKWQFKPALLGGRTPLPVLVLLRMSFRAPREPGAAAETSAQLVAIPRQAPRARVPALAFQTVPPGSGLKLIRSVRPQYTAEGMRRRIQGAVSLNIIVLSDGTVGEAEVAKSLDRQSGLDDEAVLAARYWLFEPAVVDGQAVAVRTQLELEFRMR
jgi:TonB family protein